MIHCFPRLTELSAIFHYYKQYDTISTVSLIQINTSAVLFIENKRYFFWCKNKCSRYLIVLLNREIILEFYSSKVRFIIAPWIQYIWFLALKRNVVLEAYISSQGDFSNAKEFNSPIKIFLRRRCRGRRRVVLTSQLKIQWRADVSRTRRRDVIERSANVLSIYKKELKIKTVTHRCSQHCPRRMHQKPCYSVVGLRAPQEEKRQRIRMCAMLTGRLPTQAPVLTRQPSPKRQVSPGKAYITCTSRKSEPFVNY